MKKYVMSLINAMLRKDPSILPLEKTYWAFENGRPAALCMMQSFHVFSGLNAMGEIYEDRKQGITFFYANMAEGNHDSVLYGSIEIKHERIQGIELTILRSRADTGFAFYPKEIGIAGTEWTRPICDNEKASRKELEALAAKLYKGEDLTSYVFDDTCLLMENGGYVKENPEYSANMWGENFQPGNNGLVPVKGTFMPLKSRQVPKTFVDENKGIAGVWAVIDGFTAAYVEHENSSCFVPSEVIERHMSNCLWPEKCQEKSILRKMPASILLFEMFRMYKGKIFGQHRFSLITAPGASFPWSKEE